MRWGEKRREKKRGQERREKKRGQERREKKRREDRREEKRREEKRRYGEVMRQDETRGEGKRGENQNIR